MTNPAPRSTEIVTARMSQAVIDAGLRQFMISVYNYMASGLALTGIVAYGAAETGLYASPIEPLRLHHSRQSSTHSLVPIDGVGRHHHREHRECISRIFDRAAGYFGGWRHRVRRTDRQRHAAH